MAIARDSLNAARACADADHPRSAASRAYYAIFAAAHARLLRAGQTPRPGLGTWSHSELPDAIAAGVAREGRSRAAQFRQLLTRSHNLREPADYGTELEIDKPTALSSIADATAILRAWGESK